MYYFKRNNKTQFKLAEIAEINNPFYLKYILYFIKIDLIRLFSFFILLDFKWKILITILIQARKILEI